MLHPLSRIQALDTKVPVDKGFFTPSHRAIVVPLQAYTASWGIISHMLVLATPSSNVQILNTWILTTESISVLSAYS